MKTRTLLLMCILLAILCTLAQAKIIYVDDDAKGVNNGSSWQNAYRYLLDALADANSSEKPLEIHVAQGIYKPDKGAGNTAGDRNATFQLINNVTLSGGYAGVSESDTNIRKSKLYESILSGDLNNNDLEDIELEKLSLDSTRAENSFHVITGSNNDKTAVLDGFIIKRGNATYSGGGMINEYGNPTIKNCTFSENSAKSNGGGGMDNYNSNPNITSCTFERNSGETGGAICCAWNSSPIIADCNIYNNFAIQTGGGIGCYRESNPIISNSKIISNSAIRDGGGIHCIWGGANIKNCIISDNFSCAYGGGIFCEHTPPTIINCLISDNWANYGGGGIDCFVSNPTITNCTIKGNKSIQYHGGGIYCGNSNPKIVNCLIVENEAAYNGGAIHWISSTDLDNSIPTVSNCTIVKNFAEGGGGGLSCDYASILNISSCIIRDNFALFGSQAYLHPSGATLIFSYNNIQDSEAGINNTGQSQLVWQDGNIDIDPFFADQNNGDYHLKSQAGRFDLNTQTWVQDNVTSQCIDAGDPNSPIGLEPFPNGGYINMGAYGSTGEASKSYFGKPVCTTIVAGDINGDCKVDVLDLEIMMSHWLEEH